jgi:FAD-dependent urate hydroxylase
LIDTFKDDRVPAEAVIRAQGNGIVAVGAQYDLPSVPVWHRSRTVIIGDAAHAVAASSGQGANQALESAVSLALCLRDSASVDAAFTTYEQGERVSRIWAEGAKTAASKAAGPFAAFMRDTFMTIGLKFYKPESSAWIFRHHIDWNAPAATLS